MPTIGLIVEGAYDEAAIPEFVKRCRPGVRVITRTCKGSVTGKLTGILKELDRTVRAERVLVIADADGQKPAKLASSIESRISGKYRFALTLIIIVEMLEAWLIADATALQTVLGAKKSFANPEHIHDPKAELRRLCAHATAYTPEIARRIAAAADLAVLERSCSSFLTFRQAVLGGSKHIGRH